MKVQINPGYSELLDFIYSVPEIFSQEGEMIYNARNTIKVFHVNGYDINVKSFKKPIWINRFVYKYLRKSKAERSFLNALTILERGIKTPKPIAYIEIYKNRLLAQSYYISIHEKVEGTMKEVYNQTEEESKELIQAFTMFTAEIHKKGIFHKDYSPGNILYKTTDKGYEFYLVDLNRMSFKNINMMDSCRSFSRLKANDDTLNYIGEEYSKVRKYDEKICQNLIQLYNRRFWKKYLLRHPECENQY
ncbi:lipopolysaccharide kinase InaA family protein [Prevotella sp. 10(H)]|uniref:lipopolysaccharide kinase InaA family protein n=1 Tax=Prevotella sp. 10(H) TaxID=1158294 RepID=UPI0004A77C24|nr:lipopolysaccharide kinase InaA family protein [Prevotella sp. 10(H)]